MRVPNARSILSYIGRGVTLMVCLAFIFQVTLPALADSPDVEIQNPESSESGTVPEIQNGAWTLYQVDAYHYFLNLTDRALRYDTNGHPHIVYGGKNLYYAWHNGTSWQITVVDNLPGVGEYAALALDPANRPRISYYDAANRSLKFAYFDGANWHTMTVPSPTLAEVDQSPESLHRMNPPVQEYKTTADPASAVGLYTSITVDKNYIVHISYYDTQGFSNPNNDPGVLKYARWDGSNWYIKVVDDRNRVGSYTSIAIKPNTTTPCISYMSEQYDDLKYACLKTDGDWEVETVEGALSPGDPITNVGAYSSLAFDSNGNPHISYYDFGEKNLKYAVKKSGEWTRQALDTPGDVGFYTSIAVRQSDNKVTISYINKTNGDVMYVQSPNWSPTKLADFNPNVAQYTSVAIDKNGNPGFVYYRTDLAQLLYRSGSTTNTVDTSGNVGVSSSLVLNPGGNPRLSYYNSTSEDLKYAYAFNALWTKKNVLAGGYRVGQYTSIALDSLYAPRIAYYDASDGNLRIASWNGTVWELRTVDGSDKNVGLYVSLKLDSQNRAHLSYYDATAGNLKYARWNGSAFETMVVDGDSAHGNTDVGKYSSIALDAFGNPYISYYDSTNKVLKMAYRTTSGGWVPEVVDAISDVGQYTAITVDDLGQVHISYYDTTNGDLKHAVRYPGGWNTESVDTVGNVGLYTSIAVDNLLKAHISYYDASAGNLKYASGSLGAWSMETVAFDGVVGLYTSIDVNSAGMPMISFYDYTRGELWVASSSPLPITPGVRLYLPLALKN